MKTARSTAQAVCPDSRREESSATAGSFAWTRIASRVSPGAILSAVLLVGIAGCGKDDPAPQWSTIETTSTGVPIRPDSGTPTTPSVEYIRIRMTESIFLDPPEVDEPGVFIRVRNTSGNSNLDTNYMTSLVADQIAGLGYRRVNNARDAEYTLQANLLFADEVSAAQLAALDETEVGTDISSIVSSALQGAVVGGVGGAVLGDSSEEVQLGSVLGAGVGVLTNISEARQRDERLRAKQTINYYSLVVDIELRERAKGRVTREGTTSQSSVQVSGGGAFVDSTTGSSSETQSYSESTDWKTKRTRIIGKAKGKLIRFRDIEQDFTDKLASSIAGLF